MQCLPYISLLAAAGDNGFGPAKRYLSIERTKDMPEEKGRGLPSNKGNKHSGEQCRQTFVGIRPVRFNSKKDYNRQKVKLDCKDER